MGVRGAGIKPTISERVDGDQDMADVCLRLQKLASLLALNDNYFTHVNFSILEAFLQILIDSLI